MEYTKKETTQSKSVNYGQTQYWIREIRNLLDLYDKEAFKTTDLIKSGLIVEILSKMHDLLKSRLNEIKDISYGGK
jgi:hypothetical protein